MASVSAHPLYERRDPFREPGRGGVTDSSEAVDERMVRVTGSRWIPGPCKLKVEAARPIGYRSIALAGIRGPRTLRHLDSIIREAEKTVQKEVRRIPRESYRICYHQFGRNAVMKSMEPNPYPGHEVGLVIDVVAEEQEIAAAIADLTVMTVFSFGSPELTSSSGNIAPVYSPWTVNLGPAYEFSLYHLFPSPNPLGPYHTETIEVG